VSPQPHDPWAFCDAILPDVSRSFALIIPQCPPPIDRALCVAYLLCRVADTVEDEPDLADPVRQELYDRFLACMDAPSRGDLVAQFQQAWPAIPDDAYGRLIGGLGDVLAAYLTLPPDHHGPIRTCVRDMVAGMRTVKPVETRGGVAYYCSDLAGLDQYCHYVAGTVGIMSTALFELRLAVASPGAQAWRRDDGIVAWPCHPTQEWREEGRRMGLGLQMTNIIKDCRVDAERGVSFIPASYVDPMANEYTLSPMGKRELLAHTLGHLDSAMRYILALPPTETGIRIFLLGSVFPAIATLAVAASSTSRQPKISRLTMAGILHVIKTSLSDNEALATWYQRHRAHVLA
jgi:farnesyl-diphosphate farnesyltransferase